MNIQDLSLEVLVKIFEYLPERHQYSPVCRKFYEANCCIASDKWITINRDDLILTTSFIQDLPNYLQTSLINYSKDNREFIRKFSQYIQHFYTNDINALKYVSNCRILYCYGTNYTERDPEMKIELPFLKKLSTFIYGNNDFELIREFLQQCQLESFKCYSNYYKDSIITELSKSQKDLKELDLTITGHAADYNCDNFEKMKSLEKLKLNFNRVCHYFPLFVKPMLSNISYLRIDSIFFNLTPKFITDLSQNACNLKTFKISKHGFSEVQAIEEILKNFKSLEKFEIFNIAPNDEAISLRNIDWPSCYNSNMKHLKLYIGHETESDTEISSIVNAAFPNLIELCINEKCYSTQKCEHDEQKMKKLSAANYERQFSNYRLLTTNIEMGSKIDCLMNTNRKITNLDFHIDGLIPQESFNQIIELCTKHRANITKMRVNANLSSSQFWKLISSIPRCKKIKFFSCLELNDLENVELDGEIEEFYATKINLSSIEALAKFFETQQKLKKVVLKRVIFDTKILTNFLEARKLIHFEWSIVDRDGNKYYKNYYDEESKDNIMKIIKNQRDLKVLKMNFGIWQELFLEIVNNCTALETLEIYGADKLNEESFARILILKKLKNLKLACDSYELRLPNLKCFISTLAKLNLESLKLVNLAENIPERVYKQLADSTPYLKFISIDMKDYSDHVCSILQHFENIEGIVIKYKGEHLYPNEERFCDLSSNLNMKDLSIISEAVILSLKDIKDLLTAYPNLEQFKIIHNAQLFEQKRNNNDELIRVVYSPLKVSLRELNEILQIGSSLRFVFINGLRITDDEDIPECDLKRKFKAIEYYENYHNGFLVLLSDKTIGEKMMKAKNNPYCHIYAVKKAYESL